MHLFAVDSNTAVPVDTRAEVDTDKSPKELDILLLEALHSYTPSDINVLVVSTHPALVLRGRKAGGGLRMGSTKHGMLMVGDRYVDDVLHVNI
jgi:hypothetical protein